MNKFTSFWKWFWHGVEEQKDTVGLQAVAKHLRKIFKDCPACKSNLKEHSFTRVAVTPIVESHRNKAENFLSAVKQHDWKKVFTFDEFDIYEDALVAQIIKCPLGSAVWLITYEPYSLDEPYRILDYEVLDLRESQKLLTLTDTYDWTELT